MGKLPRTPCLLKSGRAFVYPALVNESPKFVVVGALAPPKPRGINRKSDAGLSRKALAQRRVVREQGIRKRGGELTVADPDTAPDSIPVEANADADDLAAVVVRKTRTLLAAGKLAPTLRDGLTAQQLLDRRAEKAADRRFMLNLAMAMAGGGAQTPEKFLPEPQSEPKNVTEGEFSEVDLAPEHLRRA